MVFNMGFLCQLGRRAQGITMTIHDTPKRSATMPKRGEKKVFAQRHLHLPAVAQGGEQPLGLGVGCR